MSDLNRMRRLAGIMEASDWTTDYDDEDEMTGTQTLWLLQVTVRHEGTFYAGIYSSKELALDAAEKLTSDETQQPFVNPVTLDAEPDSDNF